MMSHTNIYKLIVIAVIAAMSIVVSGCQMEEMEVIDTCSPTEYLTFTPSIGHQTKAPTDWVSGHLGIEEQEWEVTASATKSALVNSFDGLSAGVTGYVFQDAMTSESTSWTEATNKKYVFEDNALVAENNYVRWVKVGASNKVRIYAYAPYMDMEVTQYTGAPVISYTLPEKPEDQKDILVAVSSDYPGDYRKTIPLEFQHCLTALRFRAGFNCNIKKVEIKGVYSGGDYTIGGNWTGSGSRDFSIDFGETGKDFADGDLINDGNEIFMLIPQVLGKGTSLELTYDDNKVIKASLEGFEFKPGKLVTFTLNKEIAADRYIYFDMSAGEVEIKAATYSGFVYVNGVATKVSGDHKSGNEYYVYQSSERQTATNKNNTGWVSAINNGQCRLPVYPAVMYNGKTWAEYITNNTVVEDVIEAWDNKGNTAGASVTYGRTPSNYHIHVSGNVGECNITLDNVYIKFQPTGTAGRGTGSIGYIPGTNSTLKLFYKGDNRLGCIHVQNTTKANKNYIVFEGTGTLTVADVNFYTAFFNGSNHGLPATHDSAYTANHWMSAIGNNDGSDSCYGIIINSGILYAGTTKAENCSAIGGGGNGYGEVTINGGTVTAVATTTGTAIGGGIGFHSPGGKGNVTINGGNVYAYNHANMWNIPSSAIGGAGSRDAVGNEGIVTITGGKVYAQSALGTAIGGGSSATKSGGGTTVTITGGHIVAKSVAVSDELTAGAGIGGGSACTGGGTTNKNMNGGTAKIRIKGNPIIRTGSIGGGTTKSPGGFIGSADIQIDGGDIQAQFIMAAGSEVEPKFVMNGGVIRDSNVDDSEYSHISRNGGAVYMENGSFTMTDGTIKQCIADQGGAVYIKAASNSTKPPQFSMSGGEIFDCSSTMNGGAIYLEDGSVNIIGGKITNCSGKNGGAIYILKTGENVPTYTMSGGVIQTCNSHYHGGGIYLEGGNATLTGGSIIGNYASAGNGGGLHIKAGNLSMKEAEGKQIEIIENAAQMYEHIGGSGGGIYVSSDKTDVKVELISGTVTNNASNNNGGGIAVVMSDDSEASADVTVGKYGVDDSDLVVTHNESANMGGGLYVIGTNAQVTINSGRIADNNTIAYTYNKDVANEKGTVTLNGGDVASVNVIFHANAPEAYFIKVSDPDDHSIKEAYQRIVTSTNSRLVTPGNINRPGYKLAGWHSHRDGDNSKGKEYEEGDIMNLSTSIDLYAMWEIASSSN